MKRIDWSIWLTIWNVKVLYYNNYNSLNRRNSLYLHHLNVNIMLRWHFYTVIVSSFNDILLRLRSETYAKECINIFIMCKCNICLLWKREKLLKQVILHVHFSYKKRCPLVWLKWTYKFVHFNNFFNWRKLDKNEKKL